MSKLESSTILDTRKDFWKQLFNDASRKIAEGKRRIKEIERAREVFRKNAAEGADIPGEASSAIQEQTVTRLHGSGS
jgi:hypothetical protein